MYVWNKKHKQAKTDCVCIHVCLPYALYISLLISQPHIHVTVEGLPCGRLFVLWLIRQELGKRHGRWAVWVEAGFEMHSNCVCV